MTKARDLIENAAEIIEAERPVLSQTLRDLLRQFDAPEPPYAVTPAEALDDALRSADTTREDIAAAQLQAGVTIIADDEADHGAE